MAWLFVHFLSLKKIYYKNEVSNLTTSFIFPCHGTSSSSISPGYGRMGGGWMNPVRKEAFFHGVRS